MLAASQLTRRFDSRVAVRDLTFEIARGEIVALLGPNGAGKTTTLRLLAGLIEPTSGQISIDGKPVTRRDGGLRARVGFLTESPGLWDRLTVRENLTVYARLHGLDPVNVTVARSLDTFGLADRADDAAGVLSKGLKQRVAIARALLHDPEIVLLDEPTSGLDPESARAVRDLIARFRDEHRTILISTHNLDEVQRLASRVAVLRQHLLAVGTPDALRAQLFGTRVRIELANGQIRSIPSDDPVRDTPALVRQLVHEGAEIVSVTPEEPSLEEVYLRLVQEAGASS